MNNVKHISSKLVNKMCIVTVLFYDNVYTDILIYLESVHELTVDVNFHEMIHRNDYHISPTCQIASDIHDKLRTIYMYECTPKISEISSQVYSIVQDMNLYKSY